MNKQITKEMYVVGIGASAGGLGTLEKFLNGISPEADNFSIVIAQHLSPTHKSNLVSLLSKYSRWKIEEAKNGTKLIRQTVYIAPPNHDITLDNGEIKLHKPNRVKHISPSINELFKSLAADKRSHAIGVILSGTGNDGTEGAKAIKEAHGFILVQNPAHIEHKGMPEAVIRSGYYDKVAVPEDMGQEIVKYINNHQLVNGAEQEESSIQGILKLMTQKTGTDFSRYKQGTISRRITKRQHELNLSSVDLYYQHIKKFPVELDHLFKTVLIGVTEFFRDEKAFEAIRKCLQKILSNKQQDTTLRIWSVGCATGEEPYSIGILLAEMLGKELNAYKIQIFATDIATDALAMGRKGVYPDDKVENIPKEYLKKYFEKTDNGYEIKKFIRQMVLFTRHDISVDPPFVRIDMITCRNVLFYFMSELQEETMSVFHFALHEDGCLVLGKSENISQLTELFTREDSKYRIFKKKTGAQINTLKFSKFRKMVPDRKKKSPEPSSEMSLTQIAEATLARTFEHPYVIVDEHMDVMHIRGKLQPYLDLSEGALNANILKIINKALHLELRTVFTKAKRKKEPLKSNTIDVEFMDSVQHVRLTVKPLLYQKNEQDHFMIIFEKTEPEHPLPTISDKITGQQSSTFRVIELEHELSVTKEHLQTYTEELETSNEELQSMYEELQSSVEEHKSTNEELETSNEELQSANEELHMANVELAHANETLSEKEDELLKSREELRLNEERFRLALENSDIFIAYQDIDLRFYWWYNTQPVYKSEELIGKTDYEILGEDGKEIQSFKEQVLKKDEPARKIMRIRKEWYDVNMKPIRESGKVVGLKSVAINITVFKEVEESLVRQQIFNKSLIEEAEDAILVVNKQYEITVLNPTYENWIYRFYEKKVSVGDNIFEVFKEHPSSELLAKSNFERILSGEKFSVEDERKVDGKNQYFNIRFLPVRDQQNNIIGAASVNREVTAQVEISDAIQRITRYTTSLTGNDLFEHLTAQLCQLFKVKYAYVGVIRENDQQKVETLALRVDGKLSNNFNYELEGAPCSEVANKENAQYIDQVTNKFPEDEKLQHWEAESYMGVPINSSKGEVLGILVLINDKPWKEFPNAEFVLAIFAAKAGAELERQKIDRVIREKDIQLRRVTENIPGMIYEYIVHTDGSGEFLYVSNASQVIFEAAPEKFIQKAQLFWDAIHPEDMESIRKNYDWANRHLQQFHWEGRIMGAETGAIKWVKITARHDKNEEGEVIWYGAVDDISQLKKVETELFEAKEKAESAVRAKEEFLATMSHEIRTPLTSIIGITNLMLSQKLREEAMENLRILKFSSENLSDLINDVLDYSKIEAGKVDIEKIDFYPRRLIYNIVEAQKIRAAENNNQLIVNIGHQVPEVVKGDKAKLSQILNNLISNAVKFTSEGTITVDVNLEKRRGRAVYLHFSVSDTGIGIAPDKKEKIFEKFSQADTSISRKYGGTGLGLTITKLLLELLGSEIHLDTKAGEGSRFYFTLKLIASKAADPAEKTAQKTTQSRDQKAVRILLVEDVEINRKVVLQFFQQWKNMEADTASGGKEALEKVKKSEYDVILMDLRMPGMDGYETARKIRKLKGKKYQKLPIIALTADTVSDVKKKATGGEFNDVITKPFDPETLFRKIIKCAGAPQAERPPALKADFQKIEQMFQQNTSGVIEFYENVLSSLQGFKEAYKIAINARNPKMMEDARHSSRSLIALLGVEKAFNKIERDMKKLESNNTGQKTVDNIIKTSDELFDHLISLVSNHLQKTRESK